jgi:hypothetical protein
MFLNGPWRIALMARLGECGGLDGWRAALEATARAEFLKGRDGAFHRWFITFDWLLQADKFTRLMEGHYAERHRRDDANEGAGGLSETLAARAGVAGGRCAGKREHTMSIEPRWDARCSEILRRMAGHCYDHEIAASIEAETGKRFTRRTVAEYRRVADLPACRRNDWTAALKLRREART